MTSTPDTQLRTWGELEWSDWVNLLSSPEEFSKTITQQPGFYRLRAPTYAGLVYIGQTGRNLRERVKSLASGVSRAPSDPPWNDPHTAAPLLWAYRIENCMSFEVSVAPSDQHQQDRMCHEDFLLHLHRLTHGYSTLTNHGRLHPLWTRPSNRGTNGQASIRRDEAAIYHSLTPATGNENTLANDWLGLTWSPFTNCTENTPPGSPGVYRVLSNEEIVYFGQTTKLAARIGNHRRNIRYASCLFSFHPMPDAKPHQLKERETDLIGAFYRVNRRGPRFQYGGNM